jgi:Holliday junction resolvase RusA-like endonuclease
MQMVEQTPHRQVYDFPPRTKERVRVINRKAYTPQRTVEFERKVGQGWLGPKFEGPVYLIIELSSDSFEVEVGPLADRDKKRGNRGDTTNYVKAIEDGLNGIAYGDDRQVRFLVAAINCEPEHLQEIARRLRGES